MKLSVIWKPGNPMICEAYLNGKRLYGCHHVYVEGLELHPDKDCVLKGEIEGDFAYMDGAVYESKNKYKGYVEHFTGK